MASETVVLSYNILCNIKCTLSLFLGYRGLWDLLPFSPCDVMWWWWTCELPVSYHVVSVCVCVSVMFVHSDETNKHIFESSCHIFKFQTSVPVYRVGCTIMKQKISVCPCLFLKLKFSMGYNFTGGRIFDFPIDFCTGLSLDSAPVRL